MIITEVKKAKDFSQYNKDVELYDNLPLSTRTRNFILKKYGYYCSFNEILKEGRNFAFDQEMGEKLPKWAKELVSALTEEGFIRPAEEFLTRFRVNSLYRAIVKDDGKEFVTSVRELTNEEYEEYDQSFNEVNELKEDIGYYLTERELKVLCLRFGIEDGIIRDLDYVSEYFGITQMRVRQIEAKALRKLRRHT